jgi:uncharacterized protein YfbU (UPF0304 family)
MELTENERLIISNQLLILEKLDPDEADGYQRQRKAVEEGYALHYGDLAAHLYTELPAEDCREVLDILDMYRAMANAVRSLGMPLAVDGWSTAFPGFDCNEEERQHSYAQYLLGDLGRFRELSDGAEHLDLNSHSPMLPRYRRMLALWRSYPKRLELSESQVRQLLNT